MKIGVLLIVSALVLNTRSVPISLRRSERIEMDPTITLVTQASYDKMVMLRGMLQRWTFLNEGARASVALYGQDDEERKEIAKEIEYLTKIYGKDRVKFKIHEAADGEVLSEYPINEMRNLAVQNVDEDSEFAFIVDIDLWPSYDSYKILLSSLRELAGKTKVALVVPPFAFAGSIEDGNLRVHAKDADEAKRYDSVIPKTHAELRKCYVFDYSIYPRFHNVEKEWMVPRDENTGLYSKCYVFDRFNPGGHSSTNISQWWDQEPGSVRKISCINSLKYEPYVVLRTEEMKSMPFSENFKGYGKNKVDFMRKLWMNGYMFYVAGGAFIFHHPHITSQARKLWADKKSLEGEEMKSRNDEIYSKILSEAVSKFVHTDDYNNQGEGSDTIVRVPCCENMIVSSDKSRVHMERPPWCS